MFQGSCIFDRLFATLSRLVGKTEEPQPESQIRRTCNEVVLAERMSRCTVAHRIILGEHPSKLFAGGCCLPLEQLERCEEPASECGGIGERVTLGELNRLFSVRSRAIELAADELECLSAVQDREDLLGIVELVAQAKRSLEQPFKFGRRVTLGRNQRRDKCQAELVLGPCADRISDELD